MLDEPGPPLSLCLGLLKPDDHLGEMFQCIPPKTEAGVPAGVHVHLVGDDDRDVVAFGIPEEMDHLFREYLHGVPALLKIGAVEGGGGVHDKEAWLVGL